MRFTTPLFIVYDILAYAIWGYDGMISAKLLEVSITRRYFEIIVTFAVGVLFGHLFLPQRMP